MTALKLVCLLLVLSGAAAKEWKVLPVHTNLTTGVGIAFMNNFLGFYTGDANGGGPEILRTVDGGLKLTEIEAKFGIDILLLAAAATGKDIVISSIGGEMYSDNGGLSFHHSIGGGMSQDVRAFGGENFGVSGIYKGKQGVAVSTNGGKTFESFDAKLDTAARYAAFPSDKVWYVAAGEWPAPPPPPPPAGAPEPQYRYRKSEFQLPNGRFPLKYTPATPSNTEGYKAQITKTTDGGATFETVFSANGTFYFNGIDCATPDHCCAVGEASGSAEAGARIYCTKDGGATWTRNFWAPASSSQGFSLFEIRFTNATNAWAVGSELASAPAGWFLHSTDGGATWTPEPHDLKGYVVFGIDFPVNGEVGYAAVDNLITQTAHIAKYH